MPSVTQRISNYLGGVSKQSDDKMLPGQVRECYNGYPDATYGLTKRPGFKHIANLGTGSGLDAGKWFFIKRDNNEEYIGCIKGNAINIWNAITGVVCTVNYGTGAQAYLTGSRIDYKLLTVQDTTIVINSAKTVTATGTPSVAANSQGTLLLTRALPSVKYIVEIQGIEASITSDATDATFDDILTQKTGHNLKDAIEAAIAAQVSANNANFTGTWTVTRNGAYSLDIKRVVSGVDTSFTLQARGGAQNSSLGAFQSEVGSISELPTQTYNNHRVKIANTDSNADDYYAKFKADDGVNGRGVWEETIGPGVPLGLDTATMPHELINSALNTFTLQRIVYTERLVGDLESNSNPSFVDAKITGGFFHNNRLGFLSKDNVCLSQAGQYYNFFFETAQTVLESDPVDMSCSSIRPTALHAVLPTAQGIVLFAENQQFLMYSDSGVLTPSSSTIRTISNYEMDKTIDPVDVGTSINFVSKTPGYSRVFSMVTRGQQEPPQVLDLSRIVKEWISPDIDQLISSPQNSMIALTGQSTDQTYIFRYYNDGKENLMESWSSWSLPGNAQFINMQSDEMHVVTKQGNQVTLSKAELSQSPEQAIIVNNLGQKVNPCMDLYATASSVVYDATNKLSKCYIPYEDVTALTPVIVIKGNTSTGSFVESGFTITPERASDGTGPYFIVPRKDLTGVASDVIVGYKYNFDVHLPTTYFRPDPKISDFTANLTIARMKFSVGLSGIMSFKVKQLGRNPYSLTFTGDGSNKTFIFNKKDMDYEDRSDVKVTINGIQTTAFSFTNDTTIVFTSAPANKAEIKIYIDEWMTTNPVIQANTYLANDVPLDNETVIAVAIHQRSENFKVRMFNNTPFPVAVNAMMWEGQYTPRFYRRR